MESESQAVRVLSDQVSRLVDLQTEVSENFRAMRQDLHEEQMKRAVMEERQLAQNDRMIELVDRVSNQSNEIGEIKRQLSILNYTKNVVGSAITSWGGWVCLALAGGFYAIQNSPLSGLAG